MARPIRIEFPFAVYHVTSRGNARAAIFLDDNDRHNFLHTLFSVVTRYNWLCHAYCLMGNHYHLIIETPDANLSKGMRQLNGTYTQGFNKRHDRVGHIFQGRFRAILVQKDPHLLELSRYVVLNPVRAGIVKAPEQWPWSSYCATLGLSPPDAALNYQWILSQFDSTIPEARRRYREFVLEGRQQGSSPWDLLKGGVIYGSDNYAAEINASLGATDKVTEIPSIQRHVGRPMLEQLLPQDLISSKSTRDLIIAEAHLKHGYELKEIADHVGMHYTSVSKIVKRSLDKK